MRLRALLILALLLPAAVHAQNERFALPAYFSDGMVVQAGQPIPIWGTAAAGSRVLVQLGSTSAETVADVGGNWRVIFDALPPCADGRTLSLHVNEQDVRRVTDVLVGEVWLCSGQSNMELPLRAVANVEKSISALTDREVAGLRLFKMPKRVDVAQRADFPPSARWRRCTPETVGTFSAVAWYFGEMLARELDVPVGLIDASWGGTKIEAWTPLEVQRQQPWAESVMLPLRQCEQELPGLLERFSSYGETYVREFNRGQQASWEWQQRKLHAESAGKPFTEPRPETKYPDLSSVPGSLYGGMIHPFTAVPVRGVIWYQGESNASAPELYGKQLPLLIDSWRSAWSHSQLPFYLVQLSAWKEPQTRPMEENGWSQIREIQRVVSETTPHTGLAVSVDHGDALSVHPKEKQPVGERLARLALKRTYHRDIVDSGPRLDRVERNADGSLYLYFLDAEGGLTTPGDDLKGFALKGTSGEWVRAQADIHGGRVLLKSDAVPIPVEVRYSWAMNPVGNLFNKAGLPASPFKAKVK